MKYFGTDGIRGKYGKELTEEVVFLLGAALGEYFSSTCIVGRDTRVSGGSLFKALESGLIFSGASIIDVGVLPTPAVSLLVKKWGLGCGVMITASHNAPEYNGLKVFGRGGIKLNKDEESEIEGRMNKLQNEKQKAKNKGDGIIGFEAVKNAREIYIEELVNSLNGERLHGLKILLDAGNGAAGTIAKEAFERLGARVVSINDNGDGDRINVGSGSEYIGKLLDKMDGFDLGFGFDGDADRVAVVHKKKVMDGDSVLYSLSKRIHLKDGVVVGTVMSNSALKRRLEADGKRLLRTAVGDKYILDEMLKNNYSFGGEQSGHYIFYPERKTGDGILTALKVCEVFKRGELEFLKLLPQKTVSLEADRGVLDDERMKVLIENSRERVESLLVRMSGTESKIRISVEDEDERVVDEVLGEIVGLVAVLTLMSF